jgi:hypothetical protein
MSAMSAPDDPNYVADLTVHLKPMCTALAELTDAAQGLAPPSGLPAADSKAMLERSEEHTYLNPHWDEPVRGAHAVGGVLAFAATDHMRSFGQLFATEPVPVYSHLVLARAALDAAGMAYWVADTGTGTKTRIMRYGVTRLMNAAQYDRSPVPDAKDLAKRIRDSVDLGSADNGWTISRKTGRVGTEDPPKPRKLIRAVLADDKVFGSGEAGIGDVLWWYLSGATHSASYALMQSVQIHEQATRANGGDEPMGAIYTSAGSVILIGLTVARAYETAISEWARLMGWRSDRWDEARKRLSTLSRSVGPANS